jgi:hypothetical protein
VIHNNRVRAWTKDFYEYCNSTRGRKPKFWTPPYTTAEPDIAEHKLTTDDHFMVLATDGLFEELTSDEVVQYMAEYCDQVRSLPRAASRVAAVRNAPSLPVNASMFLTEKALYHAALAAHNTSREEVEAVPGRSAAMMQWVLKLPPGKVRQAKGSPTKLHRRNRHDDLSIVVVFFKTPQQVAAEYAAGLESDTFSLQAVWNKLRSAL